MPVGNRRALLLIIVIVSAAFIWSAIAPRDRLTWWLEIFPALLGAAILIATYRRFRFTTLVYTLIAFHMIILLVGGHYTYAQVPLFNWLRDRLHLARNDFDRLGHFAQGFVPAMIAREVLIRNSVVKRGFWLIAIIISFCLAISALYELFEWQAAIIGGKSAEAFLGTQGDPWVSAYAATLQAGYNGLARTGGHVFKVEADFAGSASVQKSHTYASYPTS